MGRLHRPPPPCGLPRGSAEQTNLTCSADYGPFLISGRNQFGSIRFGSGLFENSSVRFGSVRKNRFPGSTRFSLRCSDSLWLGPVRFRVRFRQVPELNGSVRPVRFGFLFLPVSYTRNNAGRTNEMPALESNVPSRPAVTILRHGCDITPHYIIRRGCVWCHAIVYRITDILYRMDVSC